MEPKEKHWRLVLPLAIYDDDEKKKSFKSKERISPTAIHQRDFVDGRIEIEEIESSPIYLSEATDEDQDRSRLNTA